MFKFIFSFKRTPAIPKEQQEWMWGADAMPFVASGVNDALYASKKVTKSELLFTNHFRYKKRRRAERHAWLG